MDIGAELTLQIVWRAQTHARPDGARSPESWLFWPRGERVDWEGARAMLGALPKPLLVAPLLEPGMLGLWTADALDEPCRQVVARGIANQVQYYADKLTAIGVEQGPVRFGSETSTYEMSREGFLTGPRSTRPSCVPIRSIRVRPTPRRGWRVCTTISVATRKVSGRAKRKSQ